MLIGLWFVLIVALALFFWIVAIRRDRRATLAIAIAVLTLELIPNLAALGVNLWWWNNIITLTVVTAVLWRTYAPSGDRPDRRQTNDHELDSQ
jgi:hypothetical protein